MNRMYVSLLRTCNFQIQSDAAAGLRPDGVPSLAVQRAVDGSGSGPARTLFPAENGAETANDRGPETPRDHSSSRSALTARPARPPPFHSARPDRRDLPPSPRTVAWPYRFG